VASDEDLEATSDLPVLDLEDDDLGVRTEDRYAAIPPGPRLVRRREHRDRDRGPAVVLLVALAVLFAVAAWLDGISSDDSDGAGGDDMASRELEASTGATLLAVGGDGASVTDIDEGTVGALVPLDEPVLDALLAQETLVVRSSADTITALALTGSSRRDLPRAQDLVRSADPARVWLVQRDGDSSHATEIVVADGTVTEEIDAAGRVLGATLGGLVVADPAGTLHLVSPASSTLIGADLAFLASTGNTIATRTRPCTAVECELIVERLDLGAEQRFDVDIGSGNREAALFSPDARRLAVVRTDGIESFGVIVDVEAGTVARFRSRAQAREANRPLAWSSDGQWLFIATERNGLDAVDLDGVVARVDVELPETEALLLTG